jgi:hypothetical protein
MVYQTMMDRRTFAIIFITAPKYVTAMSRKIDDNSINQFKFLLSYENCEEVFSEKNVNTIFNNFLNTYLKIFYTSFPLKK